MKRILIIFLISLSSLNISRANDIAIRLQRASVTVITKQGYGSGSIIKVRGTYWVLTAGHVVSNSAANNPRKYDIRVFNPISKVDYVAKVLHYSDSTNKDGLDIAILQLKENVDFGNNYIELYDFIRIPPVGDEVWHVGSFYGRYPLSVSKGVISYIDRNPKKLDQLILICTPGSSGGSICDGSGRLIGILVQKLDHDPVSLMVPIRVIERFLIEQKFMD